MSNTTEKNTSKQRQYKLVHRPQARQGYLTVIALMAAISYILAFSGSADAVSTVICQNGCIGCTPALLTACALDRWQVPL